MAKIVNDPVTDSINEVQNDINTKIEEKMTKLKTAAATFLKQINAIQTGEKYNELISINQENLKELLEKQDIQYLINNPKEILDALMGYSVVAKQNSERQNIIKQREQILEYVFTFQKAINSFLNIESITLTYVDNNGVLYKFSEDIEKKILKTSFFKDGKFIGIYLNKNKLKEATQETFNEKTHNMHVVELYKKIMDKKDQKAFANKDKKTNINELLPTLYKQRRTVSEIINEETQETKKTYTTDFFLVTKRNKKLTFNHVNNLGILKEAYVEALFDKDKKIKGSNSAAANILYDRYICNVDNLWGIFGGDVSVLQKDGLSKDFAIKSGTFSGESYSSLISFANYILSESSNDILKKIGLKKNKKNMEAFFRDATTQSIAKINGELNKNAEAEVKEVFRGMNIQVR